MAKRKSQKPKLWFPGRVWLYLDGDLPTPPPKAEVWFEVRTEPVTLTSPYTGKSRSFKPENSELVLFYNNKPVGFLNFHPTDNIAAIIAADEAEHAWFVKLYFKGYLENGCKRYEKKSGKLTCVDKDKLDAFKAKCSGALEKEIDAAERRCEMAAGWEKFHKALSAYLAKTAQAGFPWERAVEFFVEKSPLVTLLEKSHNKIVVGYTDAASPVGSSRLRITAREWGDGSMNLIVKVLAKEGKHSIADLEDIEYEKREED